MWFLNEKVSAADALAWGLINRVVPDDRLREETDRLAHELAKRGAQALAAVKASFSARTAGVSGLSRITHDLLLRYYLDSDESRELRESFAKRPPRPPDAT
jgi:naphthoate synthase